MTAIRHTLARWRAFLFGRRTLDATLDEELQSHIDMATEENLRAGMTRDEARRQALIAVGGLDQARELHRDTRGLPFLDTLLQDLRFTFRTLRRDAGFTAFAVLIVGLGIGSTATVFSVINALLLRPLPFEKPQDLVWIGSGTGQGLSAQTVQVDHLLDYRRANGSFQDVAAYFAFYGVGDDKLTGRGEPERLTNVPVSQNFFPVLGVQPILGRLFTAEECKWRGPRAVLLSYRLWQRRFASDPNIVGRPLTLNEEPVTVVGVLPASFDFAAVFAPGTKIDVYSPFPLTPETNRWGNTLALIGRLKPGVSVASAQAEATVLAEQITRENPRRNGFEPRLHLLTDQVSGRFRTALWMLAGAVGVVMLIVCANLSNLLLARTTTRQKEMAIRAAMGAGRGRLVRQLLTESVVLSCAGAVLGLALAAGATRVLASLDAISIPLLSRTGLDTTATLFTVALAVLTGVFFGLAPAANVSLPALHDALKQATRGSTGSKAHGWFRGGLVIAEVALACVLLIGSGLLIRSFLHVLDVDLGFRPESAVALRIDPASYYDTLEKRDGYISEALRRALTAPGAQSAGMCDNLPLGRNRSWGVRAVGAVYKPGEYPVAFVRIATEGYLSAMGITLRGGRDFTARDNPASEKVIIINETLARRLWPGEDAIGKMLHTGEDRRVIGVVRDVRHLALEQESGSEMYLPMRQTRDYATMDLVVRGTRDASQLASGVREALRPLDPNLPAGDFRTLQQLVDRSVSPRRFLVVLLGGFATFALILASLGIYAVISYSVSQRRQEIGIRIALGASARDLQARVLAQTLRLALAGMVVGGAAAWAVGRAISGMLFGVQPADPLTFATMLGLLTLVATVAAWLPARRASRLDPMAALRAE